MVEVRDGALGVLYNNDHTLQVIFTIGLFHLFISMLILICTLWKGGWLNA